MIEIIVGVIVLILAIIGIAQLSRGRGEKTSIDVQDAAKQALTWRVALKQALYNPEKLPTVLKYARRTAENSKRALSAIYGQRKILRERFDMTETRLHDYIDLFDDVPGLVNITGLGYKRLREGKITPEQFKTYIEGELKDLESMAKRHYALRHAGMA